MKSLLSIVREWMFVLFVLAIVLAATCRSYAQFRVERTTTTMYYSGPSIVYTVPPPNAIAFQQAYGLFGRPLPYYRAVPVYVAPAGPSQVELLQQRIDELERKAGKK